MFKDRKSQLMLKSFFLLLIATMPLFSQATEEPDYDVVRQLSGEEIRPLDARVQLREVPGNRVAVIRYSGFWSQSNYDEHLAKLESALKAAHIAWSGEPTLTRYDPPYTPWFMRRNEIWLTVPPDSQRDTSN